MTLRLKPKIRRRLKRIAKRSVKTVASVGRGILNVRPVRTI